MNSVFIGHELNTAFPYVMSNLPAEIEYAVAVVRIAGRLCHFILSVMIINIIYSEIVYMNIVTFCTEKFALMLVERVGFEPGIL
jgi:hypothetical protein